MPRAFPPPCKGCNYLVVYPYASCRPGREPPRLWPSLPKATSISVPSSPCPPCLCHLLTAGCWLSAPRQGWGQLALSPPGWHCSSWLLMSLWRGPGAVPPRSCSSQISGEGQGCLGGLGTSVGAACGNLLTHPGIPEQLVRLYFSRDGHEPPMEFLRLDRYGQDVITWPRESHLWLSQRRNQRNSWIVPFLSHSHLSPLFVLSAPALPEQFSSFSQFSCPCSIPSSCVGTLMVNFTSSIPMVSSIRQRGECVVEGSLH